MIEGAHSSACYVSKYVCVCSTVGPNGSRKKEASGSEGKYACLPPLSPSLCCRYMRKEITTIVGVRGVQSSGTPFSSLFPLHSTVRTRTVLCTVLYSVLYSTYMLLAYAAISPLLLLPFPLSVLAEGFQFPCQTTRQIAAGGEAGAKGE